MIDAERRLEEAEHEAHRKEKFDLNLIKHSKIKLWSYRFFPPWSYRIARIQEYGRDLFKSNDQTHHASPLASLRLFACNIWLRILQDFDLQWKMIVSNRERKRTNLVVNWNPIKTLKGFSSMDEIKSKITPNLNANLILRSQSPTVVGKRKSLPISMARKKHFNFIYEQKFAYNI